MGVPQQFANILLFVRKMTGLARRKNRDREVLPYRRESIAIKHVDVGRKTRYRLHQGAEAGVVAPAPLNPSVAGAYPST